MKIVNGAFTDTFAVKPDNLVFPPQVTVGGWGWPLYIYRIIEAVAIYADPNRDAHEDVVIMEIVGNRVVPIGHGRFLFTNEELARFVDNETHKAALAEVRVL